MSAADGKPPFLPWIGVDFDGTLAHYDKWTAWNVLGPAIPIMLTRVKEWLAAGKQVKIFTARAAFDQDTCYKTGVTFSRQDIVNVIQDWCEANGLPRLEVTAIKDFQMIELWDDRAVQVLPNTGRTLSDEHEAELNALRGKVADPRGYFGNSD